MEQEERQKSAAQRQVIAYFSQRIFRFPYLEIAYFDAVIVFAIMLASDEACEHGTFEGSDVLHLCPSSALTGKLLERLFDARILAMRKTTPWQAIEQAREKVGRTTHSEFTGRLHRTTTAVPSPRSCQFWEHP